MAWSEWQAVKGEGLEDFQEILYEKKFHDELEGGVPVSYWLSETGDLVLRGIDVDGNGLLDGPAEVTVPCTTTRSGGSTDSVSARSTPARTSKVAEVRAFSSASR